MTSSFHRYDVIVIGGGHAGTEAALASARSGARTLLLTHNIETVGAMSCNPAIGGIGKGHLVREIDALGGVMAKAADAAGIQWRRLNASKGPAVRATRCQADRNLYRGYIRRAVEAQENLHVFQAAVDDLVIEADAVRGVLTQTGLRFDAAAVVLTAGTFLAGRIHVGETQYAAGRAGDPPATALARNLRERPFVVDRLKTGTPPRIDGRTLDYSVMDAQPGDDPRPVFSFMGSRDDHPRQVPCWITHTSERTHAIIRDALHRSPLYSGQIEGVGPRYCPSIEDKVVRFAEKASHQVFVEPEGLDVAEIYPNGISTSLPFDVQLALVRSIRGFERAHVTRAGYAIEYDYFDPRGLKSSLETQAVAGLFFAGQINGTTGYEEAAAQGLVAGVNAARFVRGLDAWSPRRDQAYIGVLIDDLITHGTREPYRMFTSRAEYRLQLREDNADLRLTEAGRELGLVDDARWAAFSRKRDAVARETQRLGALWASPHNAAGREAVSMLRIELSRESSALDLLRRPELDYAALTSLRAFAPAVDDGAVAEQVEIETKYAGYLARQREEIARQRRNEGTAIPAAFDYGIVRGLSAEAQQKLQRVRPQTIGQAQRIPGMTPAAISLLLVHLARASCGRVSVADDIDPIHPIYPDKRRQILEALQRIERSHDVDVIFACESGSRGWGFSSPDSDYDVRFIYRHRPAWYLTATERTGPGQPQRDVIELPIDTELDVSGWDLRKALRLLDKSNPTLWEWLRSPIVYREECETAAELSRLARRFYSPVKAWHHYLSMAKGNYRGYLRGERIRTKKYLYVLRPLLACAWIERESSPPPMAFEALLELSLPDGPIRVAIDTLLALKRRSGETAAGPRIAEISVFIDQQLAAFANATPRLGHGEGRPEELDTFLRNAIGFKLG